MTSSNSPSGGSSLPNANSEKLETTQDFERTQHEQDIENNANPNRGENDISIPPALEPLEKHTSRATSISRITSATSPPKFSIGREIAFVAVVSAAQLFTQAGLAQSVAPAQYIGNTFSAQNAGEVSWLSAGYSLTVGTFILPAGRWGDLYGHKKLFLIGYIWYAVWSMVAGFAAFSKSLVFLAFCRAMQGLGPALLLPNGIAILSRTYPPGPRKDMVLSIFGATAPGGFIFGALLSAVFTQFVWWPWSYWVHAMMLAVVALLAFFVVPTMPVVGEKPTLSELDLPGTILGVAGLVLFNFAWNEGPAAGWDQVYVYVLLIIGVVCLILFFWFEYKFAEHPLIPMSSLTKGTGLVFGCIAAGWGSFGIWAFYLWQFLELERGQSVLLSVAQASPTAISGALAAVATGFLISRLQPGWCMLIAMFAFLIGLTLLATMPVDQTYWANCFVSLVITCWGMDISFPTGVIVLSNHMPPEHQGLAASLVNTVVNYSISIGLGMAGTVEVHVNNGGSDTLKGYRGAWYLGIGLDSLGIVLALCLVLVWRSSQKAKQKHVG